MPAAVVDVCKSQCPALPPDAATQRLFIDAARHHRVAPLAHVMLRSADPDLAATLKGDRDTAMSTHLNATIALDALNDILDGLPWAAFKGPVLSEHAHPVTGLRSYHDVDVLVSPADLRQATTLLFDAGWGVADFHDMLLNADTPGEMHWVSPSGVLVDLHWSMINMAATRRWFSVPSDELLERRVSVSLGLSSTWTLDPVDAIVHVCLHAALTGASRMLLILDADQLARRVTDWDAVVSRAQSWGAAPALAIVLGRARTLLDTPLPDDLEHHLAASTGFRVLTRAVDRLAPVHQLQQEKSLARLIARSARASGGRTVATAGQRALHGLTNRLTPRRPAPAAGPRQPADADALERFLQAVEAQAEAGTSV